MIVDASALVAIMFQEGDASAFENALAAGRGKLLISPANLWEVSAKAERSTNSDHRDAYERLETVFPLSLVPTDRLQLEEARRAWRVYGKGSGHRAQLNFGDCFAYALAKTLDEPLLYKGDDFIHTDIRSAL